MTKDNKDPRKWRGTEHHWKRATDYLLAASQSYVKDLIDYDEHITRHGAQREFVSRLAEFYGLRVSELEQPKTGGEDENKTNHTK